MALRVGVQLHPQATTVDELRGRVAGGRRDGRRLDLDVGPLLPALRRPRRGALRGLDAAGGDGRRHQPRPARHAGHLQLVPQPRAAGRHGPHHRPHLAAGGCTSASASGWFERDYDEYGYEFGTAPGRLPPARARPAAASRPGSPKLNPGAGRRPADPDRRLAARRSRCGWSPSTPTPGTPSARPRTSPHKNAVLDEWCAKVGRDPAEIERTVAVGADDVDDVGRVRRRRRRPHHRDDRRRRSTSAPLESLIEQRDRINA